MPIELTKDTFKATVLDSDKPALVDFWAVWCGPCKMMSPVVEELARAYEGKAVVAKVNVDEERELAQQYRVFSIPTLFIFKNGQVVDQLVGARPFAEVARKLDQYL